MMMIMTMTTTTVIIICTVINYVTCLEDMGGSGGKPARIIIIHSCTIFWYSRRLNTANQRLCISGLSPYDLLVYPTQHIHFSRLWRCVCVCACACVSDRRSVPQFISVRRKGRRILLRIWATLWGQYVLNNIMMLTSVCQTQIRFYRSCSVP